MRVTELKALARERGLRGYSWLRKAELIALLRDNLQPSTSPPPMLAPRPPPDTRTRPKGPYTWRPPRPTRGPWPPAGEAWSGVCGRHLPHLHCKHNQLGLDQIGQDSQN